MAAGLDGYYGTWAPHANDATFYHQPGSASGAAPSAELSDICTWGNQLFEDGHAAAMPVGDDGIEAYDAGWGYYFWW